MASELDLEMLQYEHSVAQVLSQLEAACSEHDRVRLVTLNGQELRLEFKMPLIVPGGLTWVLRPAPFLNGTVVTATVLKGLGYQNSSAASDRGKVRHLLDQAAAMLAGAEAQKVSAPMVTPSLREKHADQVRQVLRALDHAERCGARERAVAEELAIWRAERVAPKPSLGDDKLAGWIAAEIRARMDAGRLRRDVHALGEIGEELTLMSDRIVHRRRLKDLHESTVRPLDAAVRASLEEGGEASTLARPSLARMAARSVLPKSSNFVLRHPKWTLTVPVDPAATNKVADLAALVNSTSGTATSGRGVGNPLAGSGSSKASPSDAATGSMTDQLKSLAALHRDGVLTDEEFTRAKANLLGAG